MGSDPIVFPQVLALGLAHQAALSPRRCTFCKDTGEVVLDFAGKTQ